MRCCVCTEDGSTPSADLEALARACSPRVEPHGTDAVVFDASGLSRVCGSAEVIAREVMHLAQTERLPVRVAIAGTTTAAWVLAHARAGVTVVPPGDEAAALATVPLTWLGTVIALDRPNGSEATAGTRRARDQMTQAYQAHFATLARWGVRTCGDLAALPRADLHARMGPVGVRLHQAARGEDAMPLVPAAEPHVFADRCALEWPIDGLEPLAFVLARQLDRLSGELERADRGAVALTTRLTLVTRATHERTLQLPAPLREARVLRTLILLDLESHPPGAAVDVVEVRLDVAPGRIVQGGLFTPALPSAESLSTLVARLGALMGDAWIGAPVLRDVHDPRVVAQGEFRYGCWGAGVPSAGVPGAEGLRVEGLGSEVPGSMAAYVLRRFRLPIAVRVVAKQGRPVRVWPAGRDVPGGTVVACAGPWRTSGGWWTLDRTAWDRDEWDVELDTGTVCRLARQRATGVWELEGVFD